MFVSGVHAEELPCDAKKLYACVSVSGMERTLNEVILCGSSRLQ